MSISLSAKVVHCCRSPVGGLFRHVRDLIRGQAELGMPVGLICDRTTGGVFAERALDELAHHCDLGVFRMPMNRGLHWSDIRTARDVAKLVREIQPDIIHGHGAKGGAFARLLARRNGAKAVYTPHGGALHYSKWSAAGLIYFNLERVLKRATDGLIFESQFSADIYARNIGTPDCPNKIIHNGLNDDDFEPIKQDGRTDDFVFVGEIRKLKGLDVLLQAMKILCERRKVTVLIAGDGPDVEECKLRIDELGLAGAAIMSPPIYPATRAFQRAGCVVVPSLAESFPYIVLEAGAAKMPLLATSVGGIPEIFGPYAERLIPPNDPGALAQAMSSNLDNYEQAQRHAAQLHARIASSFRVDAMLGKINHLYGRVLDRA